MARTPIIRTFAEGVKTFLKFSFLFLSIILCLFG
jgi:hypothetical protein